jgi:hypothetical protein
MTAAGDGGAAEGDDVVALTELLAATLAGVGGRRTQDAHRDSRVARAPLSHISTDALSLASTD